MSTILIRDLPDSIVAVIDADAARLGLSRVEYIRRQLVREAQRLRVEVTIESLRFSGAGRPLFAIQRGRV